jgi:sarcosine oxidase
VKVARDAGAEARFSEPVLDWNAEGGGVRVTTSSSTYTANRLVITAGAWDGALLPDLVLPLTIERQAVFWLEPTSGPDLYDLGYFPIYAYEYRAGSICYGFPRLPRGVKASVMHDGEIVLDPDSAERRVADAEVSPLRAALKPILPALSDAPVRESDVCLFTNTPDHDFIIDFHPFFPQVLISSPCSGHGFKFASAIGEIQADLLTKGKTEFDLSPFSIDRWTHS